MDRIISLHLRQAARGANSAAAALQASSPAMTYDPAKIEDWVVCASGFWRKGQVREDANIVPFRGTWAEVKARMNEMAAMTMRHMDERADLAAKQQQERDELWGNSR